MMTRNETFMTWHILSVFNMVHSDDAITLKVMHLPSAGALHYLKCYCIILLHTLKHLTPVKGVVINITTSLVLAS